MRDEDERRQKEREIQELYAFVAEQVLAGLFKTDIVEKLIELGVDKITASRLVDEMEESLRYRHKKHILLVLKPSDRRDAIEEDLRMAGYQVFTARDGREGMARLVAAAPDLIVTEAVSSSMSTVGFLRRLRQDPIGRRCPVLILSRRLQIQEAVRPLGMVECLPAQTGSKSLVRRIKKILILPQTPFLRL